MNNAHKSANSDLLSSYRHLIRPRSARPPFHLRCPIKSSGLRFSLILSTAAYATPFLHLPLAAERLAAQRGRLTLPFGEGGPFAVPGALLADGAAASLTDRVAERSESKI